MSNARFYPRASNHVSSELDVVTLGLNRNVSFLETLEKAQYCNRCLVAYNLQMGAFHQTTTDRILCHCSDRRIPAAVSHEFAAADVEGRQPLEISLVALRTRQSRNEQPRDGLSGCFYPTGSTALCLRTLFPGVAIAHEACQYTARVSTNRVCPSIKVYSFDPYLAPMCGSRGSITIRGGTPSDTSDMRPTRVYAINPPRTRNMRLQTEQKSSDLQTPLS
jgi:hypothetical protein